MNLKHGLFYWGQQHKLLEKQWEFSAQNVAYRFKAMDPTSHMHQPTLAFFLQTTYIFFS